MRTIQHGTILIHFLLALLCLYGLQMPVWAASDALGNKPRNEAPPMARQGEMDLSDWNWERDGTILLNGQWEFYWTQLLSPAEIGGPNPVEPTGFLSVPGPWNGFDLEGQSLPGTGYATFRLRVILPPSEQRLAIHIPYQSTAYRLWANGEELAENGSVGSDHRQSRPQYLPVTSSVQPTGQVLDLVVQVSNFHHRRGGLWNSIELGPERSVVQADTLRTAGRSVLFGLLVAAGLYHLLMYRLRTNATSNLYFGLLILLMAVKTAVTGQLLFMRFAPEFPWHLLLTFEYLTYELGLPLFFLFLRTLYPDEVPNALTRSAIWFGCLLAARTLLLPIRLASETIFLDQISSVLFGLCALAIVGKAVRHGREHARLFLGSCALWLATIMNDILYALEAPSLDLSLTPVGVLGFVVGMTLLLAKQHTAAFIRQAELASHNTELATRLQRHLQELQEARWVITSQDEKLRKHIAETLHGRVQNKLLLAQLHLARIQENLHSDEGAAIEQLAEVAARLNSVREEDIRRLSHLLHPAIVSIGLIPAVEAIAEEYDGLLQIGLQVDPELSRLDDPLEGRIPESVRLTVYRVLAESLQNALAHANAQTVTIELTLPDAGRMMVRVRDDGCGFDPDGVKRGLGLQTIGARITESGGSWELQSKVGEGTALTFWIPLEPQPPDLPAPR